MRTTIKLTVAAIAASFFIAFGMLAPVGARVTATSDAGQVAPAITITNEGANYVYSPAEVSAKVGQEITITSKDPNGVHTVSAKDGSFAVDVPPQGSVTLKVSKAGTYPYYCQYHPDTHNPASITVS